MLRGRGKGEGGCECGSEVAQAVEKAKALKELSGVGKGDKGEHMHRTLQHENTAAAAWEDACVSALEALLQEMSCRFVKYHLK